MAFIDDINKLDDIFEYEKRKEKEYGTTIHNVSHWDSSTNFQQIMNRVLVLPKSSMPWNYCYTYSLSKKTRKGVLKHLGVPETLLNDKMGLFLPSSTLSIVNLVNLLVHKNKKKLCILHPAYFSVEHCCDMFSLNYSIEYISFVNGHAIIPIKKILESGYDCIWITSPIFCTSVYFDDSEIDKIIQLHKAGITVVIDESLALPDKELVRFVPIDKNIFFIYSPHKAISINGIKFSVIVCDKSYDDFLEQWVDVFSGALSSSNQDAILHYISQNYIFDCYPEYIKYIDDSKSKIEKIVAKYVFAQMLPNSCGHYITIFIETSINNTSDMISLAKDIINKCHTSIIPGELNGFNPISKFCFRVNLTGNIDQLCRDIENILNFFNQFLDSQK